MSANDPKWTRGCRSHLSPLLQSRNGGNQGVTTTFPVMCGWMAQKYSIVPAVEKVCENLSLVSSALERNLPSFSETRCGMSSALTQVTVVPDLTVKVGGSKVKLAIFTWGSAASARSLAKT